MLKECPNCLNKSKNKQKIKFLNKNKFILCLSCWYKF